MRLSNVADNPVKPDAPQTMLLNMNGADGDVECRIVAPSGREDDCFITPLGHGEHSVRLVSVISVKVFYLGLRLRLKSKMDYH